MAMTTTSINFETQKACQDEKHASLSCPAFGPCDQPLETLSRNSYGFNTYGGVHRIQKRYPTSGLTPLARTIDGRYQRSFKGVGLREADTGYCLERRYQAEA